MTESGLKISNEKGETWDAPSEDMLHGLLVNLHEPGEFLILKRTDERRAEGYTQVIVTDDRALIVELNEGADDRHYYAPAPDVATAHEVLAGWAFGRPGWRDKLAWNRLELPTAGMPPPSHTVDWSNADNLTAPALLTLITSLIGIGAAWLIHAIAGTPELGFLSVTFGYIAGVVLPLIALMLAPPALLRPLGEKGLLVLMLAAAPVISTVAILVLAGFLRG